MLKNCCSGSMTSSLSRADARSEKNFRLLSLSSFLPPLSIEAEVEGREDNGISAQTYPEPENKPWPHLSTLDQNSCRGPKRQTAVPPLPYFSDSSC